MTTARKIALFVPLFARFLAVTFPRQSLLHAALLTRLQVEGMPLNLLDNVLLLCFSFEPAQGVLKRFTLLNPNFSH